MPAPEAGPPAPEPPAPGPLLLQPQQSRSFGRPPLSRLRRLPLLPLPRRLSRQLAGPLLEQLGRRGPASPSCGLNQRNGLRLSHCGLRTHIGRTLPGALRLGGAQPQSQRPIVHGPLRVCAGRHMAPVAAGSASPWPFDYSARAGGYFPSCCLPLAASVHVAAAGMSNSPARAPPAA